MSNIPKGSLKCAERVLPIATKPAKTAFFACGRPSRHRCGVICYRLEEAMGFLRAAVALRPQHATLHLKLGKWLERAGRLDQAIAAYRTAFELEPSNRYAYGDLGKALEAQGKSDEALAVYSRYAALNPEKSGAYLSLAHAYCRARQWDKAIAALREAMRLSPNTVYYHEELAWLLSNCPNVELRNTAQAIELASKALEMQPQRGLSWEALGVA